MKKFSILQIFLIVALSLLPLSNVQATRGYPLYQWTKDIGKTGSNYGYDVATDPSGNIYVTGMFNGTDVDFDPSSGTDLHSSLGAQDIYLIKFAPDGTFGWARTMGKTGTDYGHDVATDASGNVYITGYFAGVDVDFDPSSGTDLHSSGGTTGIFLTKFTTDGTYGWTRTIGKSGYNYGYGVAVDSLGNVYMTGYFAGTDVDFDPSAGTDLHTANGSYDFFITKFDSNGNYGWTKDIGKTTNNLANSVAVDQSNNVYVVGLFQGSDVDFDPSVGTDLHTADGTTDIFLTTYTSDGIYRWTRDIGKTGVSSAEGVAVDSSGGVYITGRFQGADTDFDPSDSGIDLHTAEGTNDAFLTKFISDGTYGWTKDIGKDGSNTQGFNVATDMIDNIYITGSFTGSNVDFDPSNGVDQISAIGSIDLYFTKFSSDGSYDWTRTVGKASKISTGYGVAVDSSHNVYITGYFGGTDVDFDFTGGTDLHTGVSSDIFLTKIIDDQVGPIAPAMLYPIGYSNAFGQPVLSFKKTTDAGVGMSSYSVSLDPNKRTTYTTSDIPTSTSPSTTLWKNDSVVKIEFTNNQEDGDTGNDEIHVYFKGLDSAPLTEGKHTWTAIPKDGGDNTTVTSQEFYLDLTKPSFSELAIASISAVEAEKTYTLPSTMRMPSFAGKAVDLYQGSEKTFTDGSKDIFEPIAAGPKEVTLTLLKLIDGKDPTATSSYTPYLIHEYSFDELSPTDEKNKEKTVRFSVTPPFPLVDGYYQAELTLKDGATNAFSYPRFFLALNTSVRTTGFSSSAIGGSSVGENNSKMTELTEEARIPALTDEEKQALQEEGYKVQVKVVDTKNLPVEGANVTLHSTPQEAVTNADGIAVFSHVEPGNHTINVAYQTTKGSHRITLAGDVKEFDFKIQMSQKNSVPLLWVIPIVGLMGAVIVFLSVQLKKKKGNK